MTTALPGLRTRVRINNGAAPADQPTGIVVGYGTFADPPAAIVIVALDELHAGWIEPNGRPGTRGTYISTVTAHPDNLTACHGYND